MTQKYLGFVAATGLVALMGATQARADGFECQTVDKDLVVKVYNETDPAKGTRNGAVMILSDPAVQEGRKTIAKFKSVDRTLDNTSAHYLTDVDLRFTDIRRKGELISGTKLGQLAQIALDIEFSYSDPLEDGESTKGRLALVKRNGTVIFRSLECVRYLKN